MKKLLSILALILFCNAKLVAQDYSFKNYTWDDKKTTIDIPAADKDENEIILDRHLKIEYLIHNNEVKQYSLIHERIYINSDDAIERNNKVYIPFNAAGSLIANKVRVILKNGKTVTLNDGDLKEEVDEERGMKYNYYAVNGLEKGAVLEKLWILQEAPEFNGQTVKMQSKYPIENLTFELIYPSHLGFKTKSYNGVGEPVVNDSLYEDKTVVTLNEKRTPGLHDDERYSNWNSKLKMFRYKLDANYANGSKNLYNYNSFATNVFENLNQKLEKKDIKALDDFIKTIPKSNDAFEQIWNIENKIKKSITYDRFVDAKPSIADVLKSKQASQGDLLRLYLAVFNKMNVENQMVFTSDRFMLPFDKDFESYENLNDLLFYFPQVKKYMTPTEIEYRMPLIPSALANNNGLFVKKKVFGGVEMGIGEIGFIEIPGTELTHDVMDITIDFTKDLANPTITSRLSFGGYAALNFQPLKDFMPADEYKKILKTISENYTVQSEYKTLKTENDGIENIGKKPFVLEITFEGKDLIQKAGNNYLFSVGKTIGTQMELYQETSRMLPVEIDYPHSYLRNIKIIMPKGATVKNLDKLNMNYKTDINGKTEAAFVSNYTQSGDEVTIVNTEYYNIINYPLDKYEEYRKVINAAADFNKVVLVLNQ